MTKQISISFVLFVAAAVLVSAFALSPEIASAGVGDSISAGLASAADDSGYDTEGSSLPIVIGNLIEALLAFTGMIFLVITIYAGVMYMTAAGDDSKVTKAKGMLTSSLVGLVIIISAYAITSYVVSAIGDAATSGTAS